MFNPDGGLVNFGGVVSGKVEEVPLKMSVFCFSSCLFSSSFSIPVSFFSLFFDLGGVEIGFSFPLFFPFFFCLLSFLFFYGSTSSLLSLLLYVLKSNTLL